MIRALPAALLLAAAARAQQGFEVRRGDLEVKVKLTGSVVAKDVVRLAWPVDGRVEEVRVSTYSWSSGREPLARLSTSREAAAVRDAKFEAEPESQSYKTLPLYCPRECFILRRFVKPKQWVKANAVAFEAGRLQLLGRVRPEDAQWIKDGQAFEFWDVEDPARKLKGRISRYLLDVQGANVSPWGSFTLELSPSLYLDPGTQWEGAVTTLIKKEVLLVPTAALIDFNGASYLPVRVSTGVTTEDATEVTAGVDEKRPILVLDASRLNEAQRHRFAVDRDLIERRLGEQQPEPKPEPAPEPKRPVDYGEDLYGP